MKSSIDKKIESLSMGIDGFYKSRRARKRKLMVTVAAVVVMAIVIAIPTILIHFSPEPVEEEWAGTLVVVCKSPSIYNQMFRKFNPAFFNEFDMTFDTFTDKANVSICPASEYKAMVEERGLEDALDKDTLPKMKFFYFVLIGESGELLYAGDDDESVVEKLIADGFPKGGEKE